MSLFTTNMYATGIPLVIPTQTQQPTAKLVVRNSAGQVIQQWLVKQNKCTLGNASSCSLRCELPGIAPYHALLVIGARQIFIRALAPKLTRDGRQFNEILLTDEHSHFEIAGHRFELSRTNGKAEVSPSVPSKTVADKIKFTLARPYELNQRQKQAPLAPTSSEVSSAGSVPQDRVSQDRVSQDRVSQDRASQDRASQDRASQDRISQDRASQDRVSQDRDNQRVSHLIQQAIQPIESQLHNLLEPLVELQTESRRQKKLRKKRKNARTTSHTAVGEASEAEATNTAEIALAPPALDPQFTKAFEEAASKQAAALDVLAERITDVNLQLSAIERIIAEERAASEQPSAEVVIDQIRTVQNLAIEQIQSGIVTVTAAIASLQAKQATEQHENLHWQTGVQQQLQALHSLVDSLSNRFTEVVEQVAERPVATLPPDSPACTVAVSPLAEPDQQEPTHPQECEPPAALFAEQSDAQAASDTWQASQYEQPSLEEDEFVFGGESSAASSYQSNAQPAESDQEAAYYAADEQEPAYHETDVREAAYHETDEQEVAYHETDVQEPTYHETDVREAAYHEADEPEATHPEIEPSYPDGLESPMQSLAEPTSADCELESAGELSGMETESDDVESTGGLPSWWVDDTSRNSEDAAVSSEEQAVDEFDSLSPQEHDQIPLSTDQGEPGDYPHSSDDSTEAAEQAVMTQEQSDAAELEEFYGLGASRAAEPATVPPEPASEAEFIESEFAPKVETESPHTADSEFYGMGLESEETSEHMHQHDAPSAVPEPAPERYEPSAEPSSASLQPVASESTEADEEGEEDSVEDYMKKLLARMRGVPEEEVQMPIKQAPAKPISASPSPAAPPEPAPTTVFNAGTPTAAKAFDPGTEPFDPAKYTPRAQAPERTQNLAAMRELANSSARTAIHKSTRQRHFSGIVLKASVSLVGLVVGSVLIGINGLNVNIGLVATVASFLVGIIWGYDCLTSIRPLLQSGLVLKPHSGDEAAAAKHGNIEE